MADQQPQSLEQRLAPLRKQYNQILVRHRCDVYPVYCGVIPYASESHMRSDVDILEAMRDEKLHGVYLQVSQVLKETGHPEELSTQEIEERFFEEQAQNNARLYCMMLADAEEYLERQAKKQQPRELSSREKFTHESMVFEKAAPCQKPETTATGSSASERRIQGDFRTTETADSKSMLSDAEVRRLLDFKVLAGEIAEELGLETEGKEPQEALREEWVRRVKEDRKVREKEIEDAEGEEEE